MWAGRRGRSGGSKAAPSASPATEASSAALSACCIGSKARAERLRADGGMAQIDEQVDPLRRSEVRLLALDRCREQPAVVADQREWKQGAGRGTKRQRKVRALAALRILKR